MRQPEVSVTFQPDGKTVYVLPDTLLVEAAAQAGIVLDQPCGGAGTCGKCRVVVREGAGEPTAVEVRTLAAAELHRGERLACQTRVVGPMAVDVPETSLQASCHKILLRTHPQAVEALDPAVRKRHVALSAPRRGDDTADLLRLERELGPFTAGLDLLRVLPKKLRDTAFSGTAVLAGGELLDWEPGDTQDECFGVAVDVGTTTLVAALMDLVGGKLAAVVSRLNPQTRYGDDVVSRIMHAQRERGLEDLRLCIVTAIDEMIGELCRHAKVERSRIYEIALSGNTTMQQLLCGIDPSALAHVPFVAAVGPAVHVAAAELGIHIHPRGRAVVLPVIGGFVGGDTVAGILATDLDESTGPSLLVDIGTNGEIVLFAGGRLWAASTAAGPAFEGARILYGMRGAVGAIEKAVVDGQLRINVIGDVPPLGICGSGLIDLAAELLRHGVVTPEGRLLQAGHLPPHVPQDLARRVTTHEGRPAFLVAEPEETGNGKPIVLAQRDLRELQLATAAIRAGIELLLKRAGLVPADLDAVLIAGGFGNFIRRKNAQRIGLLPHDVPRNRIRFRGNTSLAGAQLVVLSCEARDLAGDLARRTEHVDLSCDADFQTAFAEAMIFPDGEGPGDNP